MAIRATGGFQLLAYEPGNPQFPTLPDGVPTPHVHTWGVLSGLRARASVPSGQRKFTSIPDTDETRMAGWQSETTWVNPSIVDFGVIPSPVQRTVSLYNARFESIEVTALSLPSGVTLVDPTLPVTLEPFGGDTFTLEAGTTGDNEFDEIVFFTTSVGTVPVRMIGRRVFTLNVFPETPIYEAIQWKTDLIKSQDGTEKAYSLLQSPNVRVEYNVKFRDDLDRIRFRNRFIAGESALVVAGQKWYETRRTLNSVVTTDTVIDVDATLNWSMGPGETISLVTEDGNSVASAVVDSITFAPDPDYLSTQLLLHFDGANGQRTAIDSSLNNYEVSFWDNGSPVNDYIDTSQYKFGGSSLYISGAKADQDKYVSVQTYPNAQITNEDFTIEFWIRPQAYPSNPMIVSQWRSGGQASPNSEAHRGWYIQIITSPGTIRFGSNQGGTKVKDFTTGSPAQILQLNTWQHVAICRTSGSTLRCYIDGVQAGTEDNTWNVTFETGDLDMAFGAYQEGFHYNDEFRGHIDEFRITIGQSRYDGDFTPPTEPFAAQEDTYLELNLGSQIGINAPANSYIMPVGLGYVSAFPRWATHRKNLEEVNYELTFNQETDYGSLDSTYFPTLTDLQSPQNTIPVLDFNNEIEGATLVSTLQREEDVLDSGLSNRQAFSEYLFADEIFTFQKTLYGRDEIWTWRTFVQYLKGSYNEFFVPTFTDDIPGTTTTTGNTFDAADTDAALLFGNPPATRRNAIMLVYPDGTRLYRMITQIIDNGDTEEFTVSSALQAGNPEISYLLRARVLKDSVVFKHDRDDYATIRFQFRTIIK